MATTPYEAASADLRAGRRSPDYSAEVDRVPVLVIDHSVEIYGGLTAITFAVLGIWLGLKLTGPPRETVVVKEVIGPGG